MKPYVNVALRVGRTRGCSRAHPLVNHLPRLFAQLELGAVASSNLMNQILLKRREVHCMIRKSSSRKGDFVSFTLLNMRQQFSTGIPCTPRRSEALRL